MRIPVNTGSYSTVRVAFESHAPPAPYTHYYMHIATTQTMVFRDDLYADRIGLGIIACAATKRLGSVLQAGGGPRVS